MTDQSNQVPYLKKEAVVPIEIGTNLVHGLNRVVANLVKGKSQEELQDLEKLKEDNPGSLPEWVADAGVIYMLLNTIYNKAHQLGMIEMKDLSAIINPQGNSSAPPVQ